jgi:hypothetical protein
MGSSAAKRAARDQARAIQQGIDFQKGVYSDAQGNLNPYIQSGQQNLGTYQNMLDTAQQPTLNYQQQAFDFNKYKDPSAEYAMQQSAKAMEASALAKGATGGGFAKALQQNQNNLANQAYQNAYGRWQDTSKLMYGQASDQYARDYTAQQARLGQYAGLAGQGLTAASGLAGVGTSAAQNMGSLYGGLGSAQAAGTMGASNALTSGLSGMMSGLAGGIGQYYGYGAGTRNPYAMYGGIA